MYVKSIYGKIIYMCAYVDQNILYHTLHILYIPYNLTFTKEYFKTPK